MKVVPVPVRDRPLFYWATGRNFEGLVKGVTPLGYLVIRCTDGRTRFVLPRELTTGAGA